MMKTRHHPGRNQILEPDSPLAQAKLPLQVETIAPTPEAFVRSKWFHDKMV